MVRAYFYATHDLTVRDRETRMAHTHARDLAGEIRRRIDRVYASGTVTAEDGHAYEVLPESVTADRGRFIAQVCAREKAEQTLEIGMAWGLSTLFLLEALLEVTPKPHHVVMDPFQSTRYRNAARVLVRELGADPFVEFYEEPSHVTLPRLLVECRSLDLVLIDGTHFFDDTFIELFYVHRLLRPGGVIVFDDAWLEAVRLVTQFAESTYGYEFADALAAPAGPPRRWWPRRKRLTRPLVSVLRKPLKPMPVPDWREMVRFYEDRWRRKVAPRKLDRLGSR